MDALLKSLYEIVQSSSALAIGAAFAWGICSVLLSPCHLGSIPLVIGFISGQAELNARRAFGLSTLFALGILASIALIGVITAALGRIMGDIGDWGTYIVAAVFLIVGLYLLDIIPQFSPSAASIKLKSKGLLASLTLGLIYGLALGPCSFAFMAPILAMVFGSGAARPMFGVMLLGFYGLGHCAVIAIAGGSVELVQRYLNWGEKSRGTIWLRRTAGIMIIAFGVYMIIKFK